MKSPRTPRGRAALAALAVGGGVALVAGITGSAAIAGAPSTVVSTITVPTAPPEILPLEIEKSAYPFYTRVNGWDIDKWASPQAGWDKKDQSVAVDYSVKVTKSWKAVNVRVFGEISVYNPNYVPGIAQVGDNLPGGDCRIWPALTEVAVQGEGLTPPPAWDGIFKIGERSGATFRYICKLDKLPAKKIYNTAWVKFAPIRDVDPPPITVTITDVQATAETLAPPVPEWLKTSETKVPVSFKDARYRDVNGVVKVIDTLDGDQTRLLADDLTESKTFTYKRYLSFWRMKKICRTWENTAKVAPAPRPELPVLTEAAPESRLMPVIPDIAPEWPVEEWSKTDSATVKICPPPAPVKGEDPKPPVVEVSGPGDSKSDPVVVKPVDNPKGPVVKNNKTKGRLLVSKFVRGRNVAQVGDVVTWVIKVKNIGKAELYDVKVTDVLPKGLVPVASEAANTNGVVLGTIEELAPGDSEVIVVRTLVKGRPAPTPAAIAQTRKLKTSKQRDEAVRRLRRGVICNVARASTKKGPSDSDIACIRIIRKEQTTD